MSRNTGSVWKKSRRLGFSVLETGEELTRRNTIPGQHGSARRPKLTNYGLQLQEKQRIRHTYQLSEKQFYNTYLKASKKAGAAGENFLVMLESRLDNIVYRMGFARTRRASRQYITRIALDTNDEIIGYEFVNLGRMMEMIKDGKDANEALEAATATVDFVEVNKDAKKGTYVRYPERKELFQAQEINELLVVEFYNR